MPSIKTETETVIKKILPYLERRGYDIIKDLDFETPLTKTDNYTKGYVDILVTLGKKKASFLIEAKRISKQLTKKDIDQAIEYANSKDVNVPFVVITNGIDIQCFNALNKKRILWDGKCTDKIPTREQLKIVNRTLNANPSEVNISISNDDSLPFRPGLALRQLNALFYKGHSTIRRIEKNEEYAFSDFSKLLFLKLLEEKSDVEEDFNLPYTYSFHELAKYPSANADQVRVAVNSMIDSIRRNTPYGEVLEEKIRLKNPKTFLSLIQDLSSVSFYDCSVDSKGAAFEYYVRATLKGKKLGQYFTPRELVQVMATLVGKNKIINSVITRTPIKVFDPACGTGGFLVYLLQDSIDKLNKKLQKRDINQETYKECVRKLKEEVFYGSDANEGVAASAKMNMIIAGDGHTNIQHEDSLSISAKNWSIASPDCTLILTNPPFGTSEGDSLTKEDMSQYDVPGTKGQYLFLQKMIKSTISGGEICTVIDEGVLNTDSGKAVREFIIQNCIVKVIVNLPSETFKPNKINVRSSLLYLEKREKPDLDFEEKYKVTICQLNSLGYEGSGDKIRGFSFETLLDDIENKVMDSSLGECRNGAHWKVYDVNIEDIYSDNTYRLDYKYWDTSIRKKIENLKTSKNPTIADINLIATSRGKSPAPENYVDEMDGFALVVKAGSSISKLGELILENSDWIEKSVYDEFCEKSKAEGRNINLINNGDVLLASTGDGTLGKCCVYDYDRPAIADGHVTIIRINNGEINPYYLADYLRNGFGARQINRLYTGSTGLIELTPDQVNNIVIELHSDVINQERLSKRVREYEEQYKEKLAEAEELLNKSKEVLL